MFGITNTSPDPKAPAPEEPPLRFSIVIQKPDGVNLGIDVAYSPKATWTRHGVFVSKVVEDGLVDAWNLESQDPRRVQPGDFIFQVNNVRGDPLLIIQEIITEKQLTIHVMRRSYHYDQADDIFVEDQPAEAAELEAAGGPSHPPPSSPEPEEEQPENNEVYPDYSAEPMPNVFARAAAEKTAPPPVGRRRFSPRVEALMPQLASLGDEALASLLCVALEHRRQPREAVLGKA